MPFLKSSDPSVPPGQRLATGFPVLHVGDVPAIDPSTYTLSFTGLLENPYSIGYDELRALPQTEFLGDIHCVTRWTKQNMPWSGVLFRTLVERAKPLPDAKFAIQYADNDYTTNLPLELMLDDDVLVATEYEGKPIEAIHGGPVRMLVPKKYFWKSSKWLNRVDFTSEDVLGFWEKRGYNNNADPWKQERYTDLPAWYEP